MRDSDQYRMTEEVVREPVPFVAGTHHLYP
jgi:hypothetical protein